MKVKFFNLVFTHMTGTDATNWRFTCMVDKTTTTGMLFWKKVKTETVEVRRDYGGSFYYTETGKYIENSQVDLLGTEYTNRTGVQV